MEGDWFLALGSFPQQDIVRVARYSHTQATHSLPGASLATACQCFVVCIGAAEGVLLDPGADGFPSEMLKLGFQELTVHHVSYTWRADTVSFDR